MKVSYDMVTDLNCTSRRRSSLGVVLGAFGCSALLAACSPSDGVSDRAPMVQTQAVAAQVPETLRGVLEMALDDERKAEATYQAVMERHGSVRPFVNIIEAERRHAEAVIALMQARGWAIPANRWAGKVAAPETIGQACREGIVAEQENIALYDRILPTISDPEARVVLERLQSASRDRHLPAFERCASRPG
jgi:rubrerythrin